MGTIIQFPEGNRLSRDMRPGGQGKDATIIILPSIRIERHRDASEGGPTTNDTTPRRRGRGSR